MTNFDYKKEEIKSALLGIGLSKGDNIFIHSNLGFFGKLYSANNSTDYYLAFKDTIFSIIGETGTVIVPTFTYSFCKGQVFDPEESISTCGIFSESVRKDQDSLRSLDPNFSISAIGYNANYFVSNNGEYSYGKGSFWDKFLIKSGKIVNFNFDTGSTFIHFVEKMLCVPYRYDKSFKGYIVQNKERIEKTCYHFVCDKEKSNNSAYFVKFHTKAIEKKLARKTNLGKGQIVSITAKDTFDLIKNELNSNPAFLIKGTRLDYEPKSEINYYFDKLWPINRSLSGDGNRASLKILSELVELDIKEISSGKQCFDWIVPPEWNIKKAWIRNSQGKTIVDFSANNLHLMGYSTPFEGKLSLNELKKNIYSLPNQPDLIPYLTTYYKKRWGFCMAHNQLLQLKNDMYDVLIDSEFKEDGSITIADAILPGESEQEILLSTYICHPSMANNELSGPLTVAFIYKEIKKWKKRRYTYRFSFLVETIGTIAYLSEIGNHLKANLIAGYVVTCIGDPGKFSYKCSRIGNALCDRAAKIVLNQTEEDFNYELFFPDGSDERQYCSPGFNLPVGSLMRTRYTKYKEYHTSGDNKAFISFEAIEGSINKYLEIIYLIENNYIYFNKVQFCEPQLGRRNLYPKIWSHETSDEYECMIWLLNLSDGENDLISIIEKSNQNYKSIIEVAKRLVEANLLEIVN